MADHADAGLRPVYPQGDHAAPPAGTDSPEARIIDVSRMSLCARIKHGVPLVDLLDHFQTLAHVEANLMSYHDPVRISRFPLADG